jgi:hypothetical protein
MHTFYIMIIRRDTVTAYIREETKQLNPIPVYDPVKKDKQKVAEHIFITFLEDDSVERKTVRHSQECVPETLQFSEYGSPGREGDTVLYRPET